MHRAQKKNVQERIIKHKADVTVYMETRTQPKYRQRLELIKELTKWLQVRSICKIQLYFYPKGTFYTKADT